VVHWVIFFALVILSVTGYYLHAPFLIVPTRPAFVLATMRFLHELTAFVFTLAVLVRVFWAFAGNRYAHWRAFVPLTREQWRGIGAMLRYYLFLRWRAPAEVGHNPLAALAYLAIYALFLVQIVTGFALYDWLLRSAPWTALGWPLALVNVQYLREVHYFLMFVFFAFTIHHVYSAVLVSAEGKNGLVASIFSGHKFLPRGLVHRESDDQPGVAESPRAGTPEATAPSDGGHA
jgi:Ni/Fe-hydrogenase 1 B-type cytochrome subunit